ncbi:MAG: UDP-N-acetylmuramoyl-tripeptide--D-alanyl-D-alanine ligase [Limisphaerales bacterium]
MELTLHQVAASCAGAVVTGDASLLLQRVHLDSRTARPGDLFVCVRGDRFDGHEFVADAVRQGAAAVLAERARWKEPGAAAALVLVEDSRRALGEMAAAYRGRFTLPVVAVAGSNGKTTTKELLAAVLRVKFPTLASEASFNNDIGVPLTLLRLEPQHEAAVLEVGTNHPGELAPLLRQIQPRIGVLTALGREHLEFFGDLAGVRREEGWIAEVLPAEGTLFVNGDAEGLEEVLARCQARIVRVGWRAGSDWRVVEASVDDTGTRFRVESVRGEFTGDYRLQLLGRHQVTNALLAMAVAASLGLGPEEVRAGLAAVVAPKRRLQWRRIGGLRVLDDCYNANADSALAALETLAALPVAGRRLAVFGEMSELGSTAESAHAEVGVAAARHGLSALICVGAFSGVMADAARSQGLANAQVAKGAEEALAAVLELRAGDEDVLLVKASRSAQLERLIEALATRNNSSPTER